MEPHDLRVTRVRRVFADGAHNAFTGIDAFGGRRFLVFRSATDHTSEDGVITVLRSPDEDSDGEAPDWTVVGRIDSPLEGRELRDPTVVARDDELLLFAGAASRDPDAEVVSTVAASDDGADFGTPRQVDGVPAGHWLWDVCAHGGALYGTAYAVADGASTAALYESSDGRRWDHLADLPTGGTEVSIDVGSDGRLWALVRDAAGPCPALCVADPPYDSFESTAVLPVRLAGPLVRRFPGGCLLVGRGYEVVDGAPRNLSTRLWWRPDGGDPTCVRWLPSGGDTSYADWLAVESGRALLSYYSSHRHRMDEPHRERRGPAHAGPADVYLASVTWSP